MSSSAAGESRALWSTTDINAVVGGYLRDLAQVQTSRQKAFGYKRAAAAILSLDESLGQLIRPDGTLPRIAGIGPASTRVIHEVLATGRSDTVERAVMASGQAEEIARRRLLRENFLSRAAVRRILDDPTLGEWTPAAYRGDLQMHSEWSDGSSTLEEIADACQARGYGFAAVTDHSHGLRIAGGMSMQEAADQHRQMDTINVTRAPAFRMIKGIEANIAADGTLDLSDDEAARFELVLAAPHSKLRSADDQTSRLLTALCNPYVHILAHPRGRISATRAGIVADWRAVFAEAAARQVAVEIDGDPARQDLDHTLAAVARDCGCLFALDSDAHTTGQLSYADTAIAHARLARIPVDRIVNCWPIERLQEWMASRSRSLSRTMKM